jgi:hypothetical protein
MDKERIILLMVAAFRIGEFLTKANGEDTTEDTVTEHMERIYKLVEKDERYIKNIIG